MISVHAYRLEPHHYITQYPNLRTYVGRYKSDTTIFFKTDLSTSELNPKLFRTVTTKLGVK